MRKHHEHLHKYEGFGRVVRSDDTGFDVTYSVDVFQEVLESPGRPSTPGMTDISGFVLGPTLVELWALQREEVTLVLRDQRKRLVVTLGLDGKISPAGSLTDE